MSGLSREGQGVTSRSLIGSLACVLLMTAPILSTGCTEDNVVRPANYNNLKYKPIAINTTPLAALPDYEGRYGTVNPLSGVHGAPKPVVPGDADLTSLYWARQCSPNSSLPIAEQLALCPPDGAHLTMVRIGTDTLCDLSAESVFPFADVDKNNAGNYEFSALDAHMQAIEGIGPQADILWQFGLAPFSQSTCEAADGVQFGQPIAVCGDGTCLESEKNGRCARDCAPECGDGACSGDETSSACPDDCGECLSATCCGDGTCTEGENAVSCSQDCAPEYGDGVCSGAETAASSPDDCRSDEATSYWPEVARNILRHLKEGNGWDSNGRKFNIRYAEFMDDPNERLGYTDGADPTPLFDSYLAFASGLKSRWPDGFEADAPEVKTPELHVGGISYTIRDVSELVSELKEDKHPLLRFIDYVADEFTSCPADCGALCGDGRCDAGETESGCPADCNGCGNDSCDAGESTSTCPLDCGSFCGDGQCNGNENADSPLAPGFCYEDCGPSCGNDVCGVPLDFLSFKTRTAHPHDAACIAARLRGYLDEQGLTQTKLFVTGVEPDLSGDLYESVDESLRDEDAFWSAHLGAFQAAARIMFQTPLDPADCDYADAGRSIDRMIAGRIPRVFSDLKSHANEDLLQLQDLIIDSPYVDPDGRAKPAFMSLFPFRQIANGNHQLVSVPEGTDSQGMAVLASRLPPNANSGAAETLHVIIANANVHGGDADVTYELSLDGFASEFGFVEYKLAILDRTKFGRDSFEFTDAGIVETGSGKVNFVHQMAVPSVHYIEFVKPTPCGYEPTTLKDEDDECPDGYIGSEVGASCECAEDGRLCSTQCASGEYCSQESNGWCR